MHRVLIAIALTVASLATIGCESDPNADAPNASAVQAEPVASTKALRDVALEVLCADCGNSTFHPDFQEQVKLLNAAGPELVPLLTEMVADNHTPENFIRGASRLATKYPYSEAFRNALRNRRDDHCDDREPRCSMSYFDYFVTFGDETDLAWMECAAESLDERRRKYADEPIEKLRLRLGK